MDGATVAPAPTQVLSIDPGIFNLGLARYDPTDERIHEWRVVDIVAGRKRPSIGDVAVAGAYFVGTLDLAAVGTIRIESQPSVNTCMKTLSHVLQALFTVAAPHATVDLVQPKRYKKTGGSYASRKKDSVDRVRAYIDARDDEWRAVFDGEPKKDDMADALLLAMWKKL